jgi:hypothetical protein
MLILSSDVQFILMHRSEAWYFKVCNSGFEISRELSQSKKEIIASTDKEVKKSIASFVRSVISMSQNVGPLPRERCLTMRLYYNPYNPPPADFDFNPDFQHTEDRLKWCTKPECLTLGDAPNCRGNCLCRLSPSFAWLGVALSS